MNRIAYIYYEEKFAGTLNETIDGYHFEYDENYLLDKNNKPISLLLPLNQKVYKSNILFPFFDGLIPEGFLLETAIKRWKLDYKDRFGILLETCSDCIGAVSVRKEKTNG